MANEAYISGNTWYKVNGEAGADYAWSMEGVTNSNGQVSAQIDLGAVPRPFIVDWICEAQFQATPTQGLGIELYYSAGEDATNTRLEGDIGVSDAALGDVDMRRNLHLFGYVVSENAAASEKCIAAGSFIFYKRYLSFVGYNGSGASINATDSNFVFKFTLRAVQGQ